MWNDNNVQSKSFPPDFITLCRNGIKNLACMRMILCILILYSQQKRKISIQSWWRHWRSRKSSLRPSLHGIQNGNRRSIFTSTPAPQCGKKGVLWNNVPTISELHAILHESNIAFPAYLNFNSWNAIWNSFLLKLIFCLYNSRAQDAC